MAVAVAFAVIFSPATREPNSPLDDPMTSAPSPRDDAAIHPLDGIWWRLTPNFASPSDLAGLTLLAGSFREGATATVTRELPHLRDEAMRGGVPFAFGRVAEGEVGYGLWTGRVSELRAVTTATGAERLLLKTPEVIHAAAFDRGTGNLYYISLDAQDRLDAKLMRASVSGGHPVVIAELPPEATSKQVDLRVIVSADGRWIVVVDCRLQCVALGYPWDRPVADAASDPDWTVTLDGTYDVLDATDDVFFAGQACGAPCALTVVTLSGADEVPEIRFCDRAVAISNSRGAATIVSDASTEQTCGDPEYRLYAWMDQADAVPPRQIARFGTRQRTLVAGNGSTGYDLPPGWFVVGPHGHLIDESAGQNVPMLINVDSGAVLEGKQLIPD